MPIEFRCPSQATDVLGQISFCNQLLKAEEQHVGKKVRCPKCNQQTIIPTHSNTQSRSDEASQHPAAIGTGSQQLKVEKFDPFVRCPECGSLLDRQKRCTKCRYAHRTSKSDDLPLNEMEVKTTGFLLFLRKKLAKDLSPAIITIVCFGFLFLVCFICLTSAYCALGWFGLMVIPVLFAMVAAAVVVYLKIRELSTVPGAPLAIWQKPLWDLVLNHVRGSNWNTKYVEQGAKVLDLRSDPPSDQELFMLPELSKCRVLDLEGAQITDAGLVALRSLTKLKYLNLKNTNVTADGVFRLHQTIPEAWVWH